MGTASHRPSTGETLTLRTRSIERGRRVTGESHVTDSNAAHDRAAFILIPLVLLLLEATAPGEELVSQLELGCFRMTGHVRGVCALWTVSGVSAKGHCVPLPLEEVRNEHHDPCHDLRAVGSHQRCDPRQL